MPRRLGRDGDLWAQIGLYSSLGFILPAGAVAGYVLGWLLDKLFHTRPILAILMAFLGVAGGIVEILRILTREEKRELGEDANRRRDDEPGAR